MKINCSMIVIFYTHDKVNLYKFCYMKNLRFLILFGRFNFEACNVCKVLMRGSHNLSSDVKMTKNIRRPNCRIIANNVFITFQNNQVNYANLSNHDSLSMI
jgi:hypothetical protein